MLSPPYAVTEMTVFFFTCSALPLGLAKNFTTFFFPFYLIFRGIAFVDDVHDFVDVLVGEVFVLNEWAVDERAVARVGQSADDAATFQPMPCVLEEPAEAGPEESGDADVDNCGDEQDDGYPEEDEFCNHATVFLVGGFPVFRCYERIHFLLRDNAQGV